MTPPKWSRAAMASRAMMGGEQFTVFVEGKDHDAAYYDRLLASDAELVERGFQIVRGSEVADTDAPSGGKQHLLQLHDFYVENNALAVDTKSGTKMIVFFMDRDFDDFHPGLHSSDHVVYTYSPDVEAEIFRRGKIDKAISTVFSLTAQEALCLTSKLGPFSLNLAILWKEWITMCVASGPLRSRCRVQPSKASKVNAGSYGEFDSLAYKELYAELISTALVEEPESIYEEIATRVDLVYTEMRYRQLIKGKLLPGYVLSLISLHHEISSRDRHLEKRLVAAMLDSIDFVGPSHHARRLLQLVH